MATLPTPEEVARRVLYYFVHHFNCRPGHTLLLNNLMKLFEDGFTHEEINSG
jgi:hypothetical protein